jgi:hypothetical protein
VPWISEKDGLEYVPMIARHVMSHPETLMLFFSPFELISRNMVPTMIITSSKPYIFLRPKISAAKPKPTWPSMVPARVEHIIAVLTDDGTDGTTVGSELGQ